MTTLSSLTLSFLEKHPDEAARVLERLPTDQAGPLLAGAPARAIGPVVERMLPSPAAQALLTLEDPGVAAVLGAMRTHGAAALLRHMPARRSSILELLPRMTSRGIRRQLEYPADSIGAWMDAMVVRLRTSTPVEQALEMIRRHAHGHPDAVYVVGEDESLAGWVEVARLVRARARMTVGQLARRPPRVLKARANLIWVRDDPAWLQTSTLPVLDQGRLVGALHHVDLNRALQAHAPASAQIFTAQTVEAGIQMYWSALVTLLSAGLSWVEAFERSTPGRRARGR